MAKRAIEMGQRSSGATRLYLFDASPELRMIGKGTASSATATTIVLGIGASGTDDWYNTHRIKIISGTGEGQDRAITDYTGSTRTATVATWATTPDSTSTYEIHEVLSSLTSVVEVTTTDLTLASKAITTQTQYTDAGDPIMIGQGVQYTVAGGSAKTYQHRITVTTTGGDTLQYDVYEEVV